jgi:hypothetical protein
MKWCKLTILCWVNDFLHTSHGYTYCLLCKRCPLRLPCWMKESYILHRKRGILHCVQQIDFLSWVTSETHHIHMDNLYCVPYMLIFFHNTSLTECFITHNTQHLLWVSRQDTTCIAKVPYGSSFERQYSMADARKAMDYVSSHIIHVPWHARWLTVAFNTHTVRQ